MTLPVDVTTITVTGTWMDFQGTLCAGNVVFQGIRAQDPAHNDILVPKPIQVSLDGSGHISVVLPATNDPDLTPSGWAYSVTENIIGVPALSYNIIVDYLAPGSTVDLADLQPVTVLPDFSNFVLSSEVGSTNGVAELDSAGFVPLAELGHLGTAAQYNFGDFDPAGAAALCVPILNAGLISWALVQAYRLVSITRASSGAVVTASIVWPDGSTGTFTTDTASIAFPGSIDAYHVTYVPASGPTKTVTQTAVTRDSSGAVTSQPALTVT